MNWEQFNWIRNEWTKCPNMSEVEHMYDITKIGLSMEWDYYLWEMKGSFYLIRIKRESPLNSRKDGKVSQ